MISSWKNFALLTGTGEKLDVLLKATAVKLRHHQGDPSVCHFEPVRCTQGKLRGEIFFLCLKTPKFTSRTPKFTWIAPKTCANDISRSTSVWSCCESGGMITPGTGITV